MAQKKKVPKGQGSRRAPVEQKPARRPLDAAVLRSASECWAALKAYGGLDVERYDAPILDELRSALRLSGSRALEHELSEAGTSTEAFVGAFFKAIAPYGMMMRELLGFFEKAAAQRSSSGSLRIEFDFKKSAQLFAFDLTAFRAWEARLSQVERVSEQRVWTYTAVKRLEDILAKGLDGRQSGGRISLGAGARHPVEVWLQAYREEGRWAGELPVRPEGVSVNATIFAVIWELWVDVVQASTAVSPSRHDLQALRWGPNDAEVVSGLTRWNLRQLDEGSWAGEVAEALLRIAQGQPFSPQAVEQLTRLIAERPVTSRSVVEEVKILEDLLSLPAWEHRHDLYAAWVGARIVRCLDGISTVHSVDGLLRYAFSGSHLATMRGEGGHAFLWAELRTPLAAPRGKSRKGGIQPDYSLQLEPVTYPERCVLAVECKQYLKAARRPFVDALHDYLNGRKKAHVLLVNYGPARANLVEELEVADRSRATVIGEFRPDRPAQIAQFCTIVRAATKDVLAAAADQRAGGTTIKADANEANAGGVASSALVPSHPPVEQARVTLVWGAVPSDLDLHVWTRTEGGQWDHVHYGQPGRLDTAPWAKLRSDARSGNSQEVVDVSRSAEFRCAVHNYSNEASLKDSECRVTLELRGAVVQVECPREGDGRWWDVAWVSLKEGRWQLGGQLMATEPSPTSVG